jgi:hypothetical protein
MIDLDKMTVAIGTQSQRIMRFDTWWVVPGQGLAVSLDQAKEAANLIGVPYNIIRPMTVAIGEDGLYEVMLC